MAASGQAAQDLHKSLQALLGQSSSATAARCVAFCEEQVRAVRHEERNRLRAEEGPCFASAWTRGFFDFSMEEAQERPSEPVSPSRTPEGSSSPRRSRISVTLDTKFGELNFAAILAGAFSIKGRIHKALMTRYEEGASQSMRPSPAKGKVGANPEEIVKTTFGLLNQRKEDRPISMTSSSATGMQLDEELLCRGGSRQSSLTSSAARRNNLARRGTLSGPQRGALAFRTAHATLRRSFSDLPKTTNLRPTLTSRASFSSTAGPHSDRFSDIRLATSSLPVKLARPDWALSTTASSQKGEGNSVLPATEWQREATPEEEDPQPGRLWRTRTLAGRRRQRWPSGEGCGEQEKDEEEEEDTAQQERKEVVPGPATVLPAAAGVRAGFRDGLCPGGEPQGGPPRDTEAFANGGTPAQQRRKSLDQQFAEIKDHPRKSLDQQLAEITAVLQTAHIISMGEK